MVERDVTEKLKELLEESTTAHQIINERLSNGNATANQGVMQVKRGVLLEWVAIMLIGVIVWIYTQDRLANIQTTNDNLKRIEEVTKIQNQVVAKLERIFADHQRYDTNFNVLKLEKPRYGREDHIFDHSSERHQP